MREIKFRAWHKMKRKLVSVVMLSVGNNILGFDDGDAIEYGNMRDFELMQYTGLKDVNGVEIYEGDILQDPDDGRFCYEVEYDYGRFSCGDNDLIDCLGCNIVGNVFENPELLEETE